MNNFSCRLDCKRTDLKLEDMKWEPYLQAKNRGVCRACNSKYEVIRRYAKEAEKNPDKFMTCNGCDRIFKKHQTGTPNKLGQQKLRTCCPFCESKEIEEY